MLPQVEQNDGKLSKKTRVKSEKPRIKNQLTRAPRYWRLTVHFLWLFLTFVKKRLKCILKRLSLSMVTNKKISNMQIVFISVSFLFTNSPAVMNVSRKSQEITLQEILAFQRKSSNWQFKGLLHKQLCKCFEKKSGSNLTKFKAKPMKPALDILCFTPARYIHIRKTYDRNTLFFYRRGSKW